MISGVNHIMRFKYPVFIFKNHKTYKVTQKYGPFKLKNKSVLTVPQKYLMADLLDKDFKTTVLKMLEELMWRKSRKQCMNKIEILMRRYFLK